MVKIISCIDCENPSCLLKQHCDTNFLNKLDLVKDQNFEKEGQYLFREGNNVHGVFVIQKGKVKIVSDEMHGKYRIVRMANDGHFVGHHCLTHETYPVSAVTIEDSILCFIDNENMFKIFMQNPKLSYMVMKFYVTELQKLEFRLKNTSLLDCREKVAEALLDIKDVFGLNKEDNSLNAALTRMEIAELAGVEMENVIRNLTKFEQEGFILKKGKKIVLLDEVGLRNLIMNVN
ncbi:MAG: Crp/Fnr family transcriptional regulator [Bacteroidota bacterium]